MEHIEKLNVRFSPAQVLKAELMNVITGKIDEVVDAANRVNVVDAKTKENALLIQNMKDSVVWLPQSQFDDMNKAGLLDPTKEYRTYEE